MIRAAPDASLRTLARAPRSGGRDSARMQDGKLVSFGGLPEVDWEGWGFSVPGMNPLLVPTAARSVSTPSLMEQPFFASWALATLSAMSIDSALDFLSGAVERQFLPDGEVKPLPGAAVYAAALTSIDRKRGGRLIQHTDAKGRYYTMSSLEPIIGGAAKLFAVDPDFGVTANATSTARACARGRCLYMASPMLIEIAPADLGDALAPWLEADFSGEGRIAADTASVGKALDLVVKARDNRSAWSALKGGALLDGGKLANFPVEAGGCPGNFCPTQAPSTQENGMAKWLVRLPSLAEGPHRLEILVKDEAGNVGRLVRDFVVASFSPLGPNLPNHAPVPSLAMDGTLAGGVLTEVSTKALVKVRFDEPVKGISETTLALERSEGGAWVAETARLIGPAGPIGAVDWVQSVLVRIGTLQTDTLYRVRFAGVVDSEGKAPDPVELRFRTERTQALGTLAIGAPTGKVAALGARVFVQGRAPAAGWGEYLTEYQISGQGLARKWRFGALGSGDTANFGGQMIDGVTTVSGVKPWADPSAQTNLLLVTTSPQGWDNDHQGVLWAFQCCDGSAAPELLFAVSLGPGVSGYSPTVDARGRVLAVGRLSSSVLLIDLVKAVSGWNQTYPGTATRMWSERLAMDPGGANTGCILQPFYLTDPEGSYLPSHVGVGLLGSSGPAGPGALRVAVGTSNAPLRGMPVATFPLSATGALTPNPPFLPSPADPRVDARVTKTPLADGEAAMRVGAIPELSIADGANVRTVNLALATTNVGQHFVVVDETDPAAPVANAEWRWPKTALWPDSGFQVLRRTPVVDRFDPAKVLVSVTKLADNSTHFYVLDLGTPADIKVVAHLPGTGLSPFAWLEYGIVHQVSTAGLSSTWCYTPMGAGASIAQGGPSMGRFHPVSPQTIDFGSLWKTLASLLGCQAPIMDHLKLDFVTINQGVMRFLDADHQAEDARRNSWKSQVPLIASRAALISAYVVDPAGQRRKVKVKMTLTTPGVSAPLVLETTTKAKLAYDFDHFNGDQNDPNRPSDGAFFTVPANYLGNSSQPIQLRFDLSFADSSTQGILDQPTPMTLIPAVKRMTVHLVPVDYRTTSNPGSSNLPSSLDSQRATIEKRIQAMLPYSWNLGTNRYVDVVQESPFVYQEGTYGKALTQDPTTHRYGYDQAKLFQAVGDNPSLNALANGLPNNGYLVLLIPRISGVTVPTGSVTWHPGATSGGSHWCYILENLPMDTIHELGHAHGRPHAPYISGSGQIDQCDTEWPSTPPYATAHIGVWGWDVSGVSDLAAIATQAGGVSNGDLKNPASYRDLMSYADNREKWISDYTFGKAAAHTGPTGARDGLTLEGALAKNTANDSAPLCAPNARLRVKMVFRGQELGPADLVANGGPLSFTVSPATAGDVVPINGKLYYQAGPNPQRDKVTITATVSTPCPGNPNSQESKATTLWQWDASLNLEPKQQYPGSSYGSNPGIPGRFPNPNPSSATSPVRLLLDDQACYQVQVRFQNLNPPPGGPAYVETALYNLDPAKVSYTTTGLSGASAQGADPGNAIIQYVAPPYATTSGGAGRLEVRYIGADEGVPAGITTGQDFMVEKYTVKIDATPAPAPMTVTKYMLLLYRNSVLVPDDPAAPQLFGDWSYYLLQYSGTPPSNNEVNDPYPKVAWFSRGLGARPLKLKVDVVFSLSNAPDVPLEPRATDSLTVTFP